SADLSGRALHVAILLGGLVLAASGIVLLVGLNSGRSGRKSEEAPIIYRPPVDPLARDFVYFFAIAPALIGSLISGLFNLDHVVGGAGIARWMPGLAVVVAAGGSWRCAACGLDLFGCQPSPSVSRRGAGTHAMDDHTEIQRKRRRCGVARIRHGRHPAGRYRATVSRPGAGSATGVRAAGERAAAAIADRLGHRPSQDAVAQMPSWEEARKRRPETRRRAHKSSPIG